MSPSSYVSSTPGPSRLIRPEEVQALRDLLTPQIEAASKLITDRMPEELRTGWTAFARGWGRVKSEAPSWSRAPVQMKDAEEQGRLLRMWLSLLAANYVRPAAETSGVQPVGWLPTFVLPSDVVALKMRLDPYVRGFDQKVASCPDIPESVRVAWTGVSKAWRAFFEEDVGIFHVGTQMDRGETFERDLLRWQKTLDAYKCAASGPGLPRLRVQENEPFDDPDAPPAAPSQWAGAVQTVAIAGVLLAAIGLVGRYRQKGS